MEKQKRINTLVICGLIAVVTVMSIGFAAMSQQLQITGTASVKSTSTSWNVYFSEVSSDKANTGSWATSPSISTNSTLGNTSNTITFACELLVPGDSCTVTGTVANGGTIDALYTGYNLNVKTGTTANLDSSTEKTVTLDDGVVVTLTPPSWTANTTVLIPSTDTAGTNEVKDGSWTIKMELPETVTTLPSEATTHTVTLDINFKQNS